MALQLIPLGPPATDSFTPLSQIGSSFFKQYDDARKRRFEDDFAKSNADLIGGMTQGLTRQHAAEFSFFLAVPTMFGATVKSIYDYVKDGGAFTSEHLQLFAVGNVVAFVVAIIAIRTFIAFLSKHGFRAFGWYRIVVGGIIILLYLLDVPMQMM